MEVLHLFSLRLVKRKPNCLAASLDSKVLEQWLYTFFGSTVLSAMTPACLWDLQVGSPVSKLEYSLSLFSCCASQPCFLLLLLYSLFLLGMSSLQSLRRLLTMETLVQILARAAGPHVSLPVRHLVILGHIPCGHCCSVMLCQWIRVVCHCGHRENCGRQGGTTSLSDGNRTLATKWVGYHQCSCDPSAVTYSPCQIS